MKNFLKTSIIVLFLITCTLKAQTKTIMHRAGNPNFDYSTEFINAAKNNQIIKFQSGKTYKFKKAVTLSGKINSVQATGNTNAKLQVAGNFATFITLGKKVNFKRLTFDHGNKGTPFSPIVNLNNKSGVKFEFCTFQNSKGGAIAAGKGFGYHTNGLKVLNCKINNVTGTAAITLIDRRTNKRDNKGNFTQFGKKNPVLAFTQSVQIKNTVFTNYDVGIRMDCGNDFYKNKSSDRGVRRYEGSTNVKLTVENCTFNQARRWNIGAVQAQGMNFNNNTFVGGGTNNYPNPSSFHIEQFCKNVTVKNNTFNIKKGIIFSIVGKEGYKRYTENPITLYDNKGGRDHPIAEASPTCNTGLLCKRDIHSYGPRNFVIQGNKFNSKSSNVSTVISVNDSEGFRIGGSANNLKNSYSGNFKNKKLFLKRGDSGHKNMVIADRISACDIKTEGNVWFNNQRSNIKLNGSNFNGCTNRKVNEKPKTIAEVEEEQKTGLSFYPNPASNKLHLVTGDSDYNVEIYGIMGNKIKSYQVHKNSNIEVSISDIKSGVYLVRYISKNETSNQVKRLIIK
ncbi:T9SS type A sorting domain-containing protein [Flavivirga abyssicola]|uniref:T9SS type A sorting domain-containing protein n=1 Tax=Flavivirga abyssicola TaxID=3063533 RepID=UPI0026E0CED1|nr:T9SS type A sorting domain-containing protein [Flavivirga sp. MEBiC07777]WVK12162.1 T9SS type A sorting domain-containing protein [Flavivirga sp. MEBiC07777]